MINEILDDGTNSNPCTRNCHDALEDFSCPAMSGEQYCPFFAGALRTYIGRDPQRAVYTTGDDEIWKFPNPDGLDFEVPGPGLKDAPIGNIEVRGE